MLDAAHHDDRAQGIRGERRGATARAASEHGVFRGSEDLAGAEDPGRGGTWVTRRSPTASSSAADRAASALAARLKRLEVPTLIIEKNHRPGDSWRNRYKSLCLHDPVWYDHLPYLPFPDHWPVFSPKDKIGDWLEMYAKVMELELLDSTECEARHYDESKNDWTVTVDREGETVVLRPKQLVLATGMSGMPNFPRSRGRDASRGRSIIPARSAAATTTAARSASCWAPTIRLTTSVPLCGSRTRTSP